jgi:hypothetical protein
LSSGRVGTIAPQAGLDRTSSPFLAKVYRHLGDVIAWFEMRWSEK